MDRHTTFPEACLWRARPDGSDRRQLTFPPLQAFHGTWLPDSRRLAIRVLPPDGKPGKICIVPVDGSKPEVLFENEPTAEDDPTFSPDGHTMGFIRTWLDAQGNAGIGLVDELLALRKSLFAAIPLARGPLFRVLPVLPISGPDRHGERPGIGHALRYIPPLGGTHPSVMIEAVRIFGMLHLALLAAIAVAAFVISLLCRRGWVPKRAARLTLGWALAINEIIWWAYRYSHEGIRLSNLPLQLCDLTLWGAVLACLTLSPAIIEFTYFAGLAGAGMALLTPDLWSPWPSYPAIYFFLGHGGIVIAAVLLVFGGISSLRPGALLRVFGYLLACAAVIGAVNAALGTNYAYLCHKPTHASLLDLLGPWPVYLLAGAAVSLGLFWLLSLPVRLSARIHGRESRWSH